MTGGRGNRVSIKLHAVNALLPTAKTNAQRRLTDFYQLIQRAPLLSGISRTYRPRDEEGEQLPPESTKVQVEIEAALTDVLPDLGRLFDLQLSQDIGNAAAKANIVVGGTVLLADVPVTYLLFLEKRLVDLRTTIDKLPGLDSADDWEWDEARQCWRTKPVETVRSKKVPRRLVLAEATEHHPAQVQVYQEDVPAGFWTTVKLSGAVPAARRRELTRRVDVLLEAVKAAREDANGTEVERTASAGSALLSYLFRG